LSEPHDSVSEDIHTKKKSGKRIKIGNSGFSKHHSGLTSSCFPILFNFHDSKAPALCFGASTGKCRKKLKPINPIHLETVEKLNGYHHNRQQETPHASDGSIAWSTRQLPTEDQNFPGEEDSSVGCIYETSTIKPSRHACRKCSRESEGSQCVYSSAAEFSLRDQVRESENLLCDRGGVVSAGCDVPLSYKTYSNIKDKGKHLLISVTMGCEAEVYPSLEKLKRDRAVFSAVERLNKSIFNIILSLKTMILNSRCCSCHQCIHAVFVMASVSYLCLNFEAAFDCFVSPRKVLKTSTDHYQIGAEISETEINNAMPDSNSTRYSPRACQNSPLRSQEPYGGL